MRERPPHPHHACLPQPSESAWYGVRTDVDDITPSDGSSGSSGEEVGPEAGPGGAGSSPTAKASKQDATAGTAPASRHLSVGGGARPRRPSAAKELDALILRDELRNPPLKTGFLAKQGTRAALSYSPILPPVHVSSWCAHTSALRAPRAHVAPALVRAPAHHTRLLPEAGGASLSQGGKGVCRGR